MQKKGISLIVLVITIIVMIILAAAIIISLNNTGIIGNANKAVDETNEKTVQEIANLAWGEAYADGTRSASDLKKAVEKALADNNLNVEDYGINVTESGVDIAKGWLQTKDRTVVRGNQVLNIGDVIKYHDTAGESGAEKYTKGWKVLGAQNGELLIMSDKEVAKKDFNYYWSLVGGKEDYTKGINELNEICKVYGTGAGATGARSITVEDVDKVTGYDKTTYESTYKSYKIKYGESVTYYWDTDSNKYGGDDSYKYSYPYYETERGLTGNLSGQHSEFEYHDGIKWQESIAPTTPPTEKQKICKLTQTYYNYDVDKETTLSKTNADGTTNEAYKMLFGNDDKYYWLASSYVNVDSQDASVGFRYVNRGKVSLSGFFVRSFGYSEGSNCDLNYETCSDDSGVRAVVTLSSNINLDGTAESGYEIL